MKKVLIIILILTIGLFILNMKVFKNDERNTTETYHQRPFSKVVQNHPVEGKRLVEQIPQDPWSNDILWNSILQTNRAVFSARINKNLPEFKFQLVGSFNKTRFIAKYVDIFDSTKMKLIQRLEAKGRFDNYGEGWYDSDKDLADLVQLIDLNFDGYLDFRILNWTGATGQNAYASYIYNPRSKTFEYNNQLSELSALTVDEDTHTLRTYNRCGWCEEYIEYYKVVKDKYVLSRAEWTDMDRTRDEEVGGPACFKYTGIPRNSHIIIDPEKFICFDRSKSYLSKRMKNIKEVGPLDDSLDGRARGPLGNPY